MVTQPEVIDPTLSNWQNMPQVDPKLLQTQARGLAAQSELQDLMQGPQMARALRMAESQLPGVQGEGYAAAGPTFLQGLANMASQRMGNNQLNEIQRQAKALRGDTQAGAQAQLEMQNQERQMQMAHQQNLQNAAALERAKLEELRQTRVRDDYETWIDPTSGEMVNASRSEKGVVDENGNPVSIEGKIRFKDSEFGQRYGNSMKGLGAAQRKDLIGADLGMRRLNDIASLANNMSEEDLKGINRALLDVAVKAVTPAEFEAYIKSNKIELSRSAKQYLQKVNDFASNVRHARFGSALTYNENALANAFLPSAEGLGLEDRTDRLNAFYDDFQNQVRSIDNVQGSNFLARMPEFVEFKVPEWAQQKQAQTDAKAVIPKEMQTAYDAMAKRNEEYQALTGKELPAFTRMKEQVGEMKLEALTPSQRRQRSRR